MVCTLLENVLTCKNSTWFGRHVNLVLLGDAKHHGLRPPVVLGGQQPAQGLGEKPSEGDRKDANRADKDGHKQNRRGGKTNNGRKRALFVRVCCSVYRTVCCTSHRLAQHFKNRPPSSHIVEFLRGWNSPDVGQHQNERANYDNL